MWGQEANAILEAGSHNNHTSRSLSQAERIRFYSLTFLSQKIKNKYLTSQFGIQVGIDC